MVLFISNPYHVSAMPLQVNILQYHVANMFASCHWHAMSCRWHARLWIIFSPSLAWCQPLHSGSRWQVQSPGGSYFMAL